MLMLKVHARTTAEAPEQSQHPRRMFVRIKL